MGKLVIEGPDEELKGVTVPDPFTGTVRRGAAAQGDLSSGADPVDPKLQEQLKTAQDELVRWQKGIEHHPPHDMIPIYEKCENCKADLDKTLEGRREQVLASATLDEAKTVAKVHKLWPPPTIDFGDGLSTRKGRP